MRAHGLDVLRGIAILLVLVTHTDIKNFIAAFEGMTDGTKVALWNVFRMGQFGVDLFFVLSGFLVSSMIFNEIRKTGTVDFGRFWMRRGLKVWPAYYLIYGSWGLLYSLYLYQKSGLTGFTSYWTDAWVNLVYLQNYVNIHARWFASWSLCVEEHFYLLFPIIVLVVMQLRKGLSALPLICIGGIVLCVLLRINAVQYDEFELIWRQTHFRMDSLLLGVLLGYIYTSKSDLWKGIQGLRWPLVALGIALFVAQYRMLWIPHFAYSVGLLAVAIAGLTFVVFFIQVNNEAVLKSRLLNVIRVVGVHSYAIYVCQTFGMLAYRIDVLTVGTQWEHWPVGALIFWFISIAMGVTVSRMIEKPVLVIRDRLIPGKASSINEVPA